MENKMYILVYLITGKKVESHNGLYDKEQAERLALELSLKEHEKIPNIVDNEGQISVLDWQNYDNLCYANISHPRQFIQVFEANEGEGIKK